MNAKNNYSFIGFWKILVCSRSKVRIELLTYLDVRQIYELANIDEMGEDLQRRLREGKKILDNLVQYKFSPKTKQEMIDSYQFLMDQNK